MVMTSDEGSTARIALNMRARSAAVMVKRGSVVIAIAVGVATFFILK